MKELSTEIEISASVGTVWAILTDLSGFAEWNPFIRQAEGKIKEGEQLSIRIEPPGGKGMTFKPTVTLVDPLRGFRWLGRFVVPGLFDGEHIFEMTAMADGLIRFVQRENFSGLLVPLLWSSMAASTKKGFEAMNGALKTRSEREGG